MRVCADLKIQTRENPPDPQNLRSILLQISYETQPQN
jgi:hypothetical protein